MADQAATATSAEKTPEAPAAAAATTGEAASEQPKVDAAPADGQTGAQTTAGFASASLYVGDLHGDVTEAQLFEVFSPFGSVASIRVCRDAITRRSLGYAYCNFHDNDSALRALREVNGALVHGKPCRVMWSQRDPASRKSGKGNVFIKNLEKSITQKQLLETFEQFGKILSCKIETDEKGESKGYGYIQFASDEDGEAAISGVNGMMLKDKVVFVGPFMSRKERESSGTFMQKFTNVYVKNLPEEWDDMKLTEMFEKYGETTSVLLRTDDQGKSRGFGFVNFKEPEGAQKAVEELNGKEIEGKELFVGRAQKKSERQNDLRAQFEQRRQERLSKYEGVNLYVKNIDDDVDDDKLREMFEPFGTISSTKVMRDQKSGASRGFGFVCFASPDEATKAVTTMNGKISGTKPMFVALAQPREVRRRQLEMQFAQRQIAAAAAAAGVPGVPGMQPGMARPMPGQFPPPMVGGFPMNMPQGPGGRGPGGFPAGFPQQGAGAPPMFFGQPGQPMVYPGMGPGGPKAGPGGRGGQPGVNYVMLGGRGGRGRGRGGRGQNGAPPTAEEQPAAQQQPVETPQPGGALTTEMLQGFAKEEQQRLIGERLYQLIYSSEPERAGKITGMILESCPVSEMIQLIESPGSLKAKVDEALEVLTEHNKE
jgi:polyadenylate-binding protein